MTRLIMLMVFGFALAFSSITVAEEVSKYVGGSPAVAGAHPFFFIPVDELRGKKIEEEKNLSEYVGGSPAVAGAHPFFFIPVDELTGKKAEVETITEKKVEKEKKF